MQFYLTVKGIVERDGKILVLKRSVTDDHLPEVWETPGGGVDREENPEEALRREILEETGLTVAIGKPFNVFTFRKDTGEFKVGITFLCKYESGEVKLSEEHSEYRFIKPSEFKALPSIPSLYEEIARYGDEV
ncbi:MAG: NUDIX domain-containing protein [bacterium]|nr:NUDIX domain-containing protein [bacterium]